MRGSLLQVSRGSCVVIAVSGNIIRTGLRVREQGTVPLGKVFISDLVVRGIIGVNAWERETPQDFVINLVLFTDLTRAGETDDIADCLDYQDVAGKVTTHAVSAQRFTVEALAADVARIALGYPGVQRVRVRVEKPGAVASCRSVGVEIERDRPGAD